jgi:hypothetical protein
VTSRNRFDRSGSKKTGGTHEITPHAASVSRHVDRVGRAGLNLRPADHESASVRFSYAPTGHTSWEAEAGTELLQISPSKELAEVEAAINEVMKGMQGGPA